MGDSTRRERRAKRRRGFLSARDGRIAARLARVDYKLPGETGALRVPSRVRTWHLGGRANGHAPPPGRGWERSGPVRLRATARPDRSTGGPGNQRPRTATRRNPATE